MSISYYEFDYYTINSTKYLVLLTFRSLNEGMCGQDYSSHLDYILFHQQPTKSQGTTIILTASPFIQRPETQQYKVFDTIDSIVAPFILLQYYYIQLYISIKINILFLFYTIKIYMYNVRNAYSGPPQNPMDIGHWALA